MCASKITAARGELAKAEKASGAARTTALKKLAAEIDANVAGSSDQAKARMLSEAVTELAK